MKRDDRLTKYACYATNASMSVVATLSPLLFLTFRSLYGLSFSQLGALVLINFCTQLLVDLIFSFYSHKFNVALAVRLTPALTAAGLLVYAVVPFVFPQGVYAGLILGTVIFSASAGLAEVLISPVIAALPSENPEREMSKLHSVYAWGVVGVVLVSTLVLLAVGKEGWQWLALGWMLVPLAACVLFTKARVPALETPQKAANVVSLLRSKGFWLCFLCIFAGGASECTMAQWSSGYLEEALRIPKVWGDALGVAMFSAMLGLGRTLYGRFGKHIYRVLLLGAAGAAVCYLAAALSGAAWVALTACALTGFCVSMLWPGSLLVATDRFPAAGVAMFALMAAGGDLGGAVGPQWMGVLTDWMAQSSVVAQWAAEMQLTAAQLGMKIALLCMTVFPLVAAAAYALAAKRRAASPAHGLTQ